MGSKQYHANYNLRRYHKIRLEYIEYMGGKCNVCGSTNDLHFDHKDASTKEFSIGDKLTYSKEVVLRELEKCQLLCNDCHIEKTKNMKDGYERRAKGSNVNKAVLTESQIPEIRELCKTLAHAKVAEMFGVTRKTIDNVANRVTWKHI